MPDDRRFHLGVACPLPPAPTGPAPYVVGMLPALSRHADVTCFVPDPAAVDPEIRRRWTVRDLDERHVAGCDLVAYHVANNPHHREVLAAATAGPPGLVVLHDASLHHLLNTELVARARFEEYGAWLTEAHGERGAVMADVRLYGGTEIEQFVFDALRPVLDRHLGVQVHSRFAAATVEERCPGLPVFVVPHYAKPRPAPAPAAVDGDVVIGHFGFVTRPKRYDVICEAMRLLLDSGARARLVFAGADHTNGDLRATIERLGLRDAVEVTGWVDDATLGELIDRVDVAVSLRWPQVGESSGTLASLLGAGKAVVVEAIGSWAEVPAGAVVRVDGDGAGPLAETLLDLVTSAARRQETAAAAIAYATSQLDVDTCAGAIVDAARQLASRRGSTPREVVAGRLAAVGARLRAEAGDDDVAALAAVPPARPGARLLSVACSAGQVDALRSSWGYDVTSTSGVEAAIDRARASAAASIDVVVCATPATSRLLRRVNRLLSPAGHVHLLEGVAGDEGEDDDATLDEAGLSMTVAGPGGRGIVARKCGLAVRRP